ncbi:MAG TPA: hypothetical protein VKC53_03645 [Patescibacteria group bacterium]|nr:hypothetical protein [Patescibacteria group bacterium]
MEDNNLNPSPIEVENVVTSPIPVEPQPKNNSALVILSFSLIILVGIIAFLGYQNYQLQKQISLLTAPSSSSTPLATADPTADWKTYINQEGKYQYSYPDSWKNTEPCASCEGPQNSSTINDTSSKYPDGYFTVSYYDSSYCQPEEKTVKSYNWKGLVEKEITLSGEKANLLQGTLDYTDNLQHARRNILVTHNKSCYEITTWSYQNPNQEKTFDQILSTFKFLGQTNSLKTYSNPQLGISFEISDPSIPVLDYDSFKNRVASSKPGLLITKTPYYTTNIPDCPTNSPITENCFVGSSSWGQPEKIKQTTLGGKVAKSYFVNDSVLNEPVHVIETISQPTIQLAYVVGGSGLEETFQQILSTFKFTP